MCGICGFIPRSPVDPADMRRRLETMNGALVHRGPDDEGYFASPEAGLGMRRLSIIDVAQGQQPMATEDGRYQLVFNGEIYNHEEVRSELEALGHRFRTRSDTESVLLGFVEWGPDVVRKLDGMFAIALWDRRVGQLFLARDWLGQKPLYVLEAPDGLAFASEPKALRSLLPSGPRMDLVAVSHYLSLRSVPGSRTLLDGVRKLPPGTRAAWRGGRWTEERYWRLSYRPKHDGSEADMVAAFDQLLRETVQRHMIADVEVGGFLSGGIDSSTVVALMAQAVREPVRTFSIGVTERGFDERPYAQMVAERYGTRHHEEVVEPDLIEMLPRMIAAMDEPVDPFAAGVYLASGLASRHLKVVLSGDGGDEMFAGYDRYAGQRLVEIYGAIPGFLRKGVLGPVLRRLPDSFAYKSLAQKLRWVDRVSRFRDPAERYAFSAGYLRFPHETKEELFQDAVWSSIREEDSGAIVKAFFDDRPDDDALDCILSCDVETRLAEHLLPTVDRMSMAHSLEVRSPFVDRRAAEYAARIPARLKLKRLKLKYMLRKVAARHLPKKLVYRKKQGFGFPLAHWFRTDWRDLMAGLVRDSALVEDGFLRAEPQLRLLEEHGRKRVDHNYRLWLLMNLELWYRMWIRGDGQQGVADYLDRRRGAARAL